MSDRKIFHSPDPTGGLYTGEMAYIAENLFQKMREAVLVAERIERIQSSIRHKANRLYESAFAVDKGARDE